MWWNFVIGTPTAIWGKFDSFVVVAEFHIQIVRETAKKKDEKRAQILQKRCLFQHLWPAGRICPEMLHLGTILNCCATFGACLMSLHIWLAASGQHRIQISMRSNSADLHTYNSEAEPLHHNLLKINRPPCRPFPFIRAKTMNCNSYWQHCPAFRRAESWPVPNWIRSQPCGFKVCTLEIFKKGTLWKWLFCTCSARTVVLEHVSLYTFAKGFYACILHCLFIPFVWVAPGVPLYGRILQTSFFWQHRYVRHTYIMLQDTYFIDVCILDLCITDMWFIDTNIIDVAWVKLVLVNFAWVTWLNSAPERREPRGTKSGGPKELQ